MPYIKTNRRHKLLAVNGLEPRNPGELNFLFTKIILNYLGEELNYQRINDCIGALECCKLEVYRCGALHYENLKIAENGDVGFDQLMESTHRKFVEKMNEKNREMMKQHDHSHGHSHSHPHPEEQK